MELQCTYKTVNAYAMYIHVCILIYTEQVVCALTSIFSSPVESSLLRILHPLCRCLMDTLPCQCGWSTYTGLPILSCVGCQQSWLSGLVRTCKMSWDFPTKLTRGQCLVLVGPPLSAMYILCTDSPYTFSRCLVLCYVIDMYILSIYIHFIVYTL